MNRKATIEALVSIAILCSMIFGAITYFASAAEVQQLAMRFDQKNLEDQIKFLQGQLVAMQVKYGPDIQYWYNEEAKKLYLQIQADLKLLWEQYRALTGKEK